MSLKTEHFTTPIKMVLYGIIVSLTWKFDETSKLKLKMSFTYKFEPDWVFDLERCTDRLLQYKSSTSGEITLVACRMVE
jgi:hypothetical protein